MKIVDIRCLRASTFLYVHVFTDEGITGLGECGAWGYLDAAAEVVESFKEYLIGKDPLEIEHHWQYMYRAFHFRGATIMGALSAIDIALWDIAGKHYGKPIYKLLNGGCRDKLRTYFHVSGSTTEELVACCVKAKEMGYTAFGHLSPFLDGQRTDRYKLSYVQKIEEAVDRVRLIREAVGYEVDLCLELHRRLRPAEAVAFAHKIEKYTPMFLEDPIPPDNFDDMALIANRINIPIATGERLHTIQEFSMLFDRNAMGYARVSVCLAGGISGARKIAALAEAHGVLVVPHNPLSPVSTAACMHVAASVENFAIQELPDLEQSSSLDRYLDGDSAATSYKISSVTTQPLKIEGGYAYLPSESGLGVELVDDVESRFPYKRKKIVTMQHIDGSIIDQ